MPLRGVKGHTATTTTTTTLLITYSSHDVHEMNAYRTGCVCPYDLTQTAGLILMKYRIDIMTLGSTLKSYFRFPTVGDPNMAEQQTCELRSTITPLTIGPYNQ